MLSIPANDERAVAVVAAIHNGDVPRLRKQLGEDPELARARIVDRRGVSRTLLHVASDWPGHFPNGARTVTTLVAAGADVNAALFHTESNGSPETALHWAASSNDVAVLDALLDSGADIEAPGAVHTGGTPMSDAVVFAQWDAARRLLECGATTNVWQAAALGLLEPVQEHLSRQPPPSLEQITNSFWHACRGGQQAVAEYLFDNGANLNWIGHDHKTPLDVSNESGATELVRWLEARGARSGAKS